MVIKKPLEMDNPSEALRDKHRTFKVISPYGQIFRVTCRRGRHIRIREIGQAENPGTFRSRPS